MLAFQSKNPEINIPIPKLIIGLVLGLGYAFSIYALLYLTREGFRILSVRQDYQMWVLSPTEVNFYNFFYAFVALNLGQTIAFNYWYKKPRRPFGARKYRTLSMLNDGELMNWYFLAWFSKLATVYGIMFGITLHRGYYAISFYPDYIFLAALILIVLFFQSWTSIRIYFKNRSCKWMIVSMFSIVVLSFGMSRINLVDYNKLNNHFFRNNIYEQFDLQLPHSDLHQYPERRSLLEHIYVAFPKDDTSYSEPILIADKRKYTPPNLNKILNVWKDSRHKSDQRFLTIALHLHRKTPMKFINQIKEEISKVGIVKIGYAVVPNTQEFDERYYTDYLYKQKLPPQDPNRMGYNKYLERILKAKNSISIKQLSSSDVLLNMDTIKVDSIVLPIL